MSELGTGPETGRTRLSVPAVQGASHASDPAEHELQTAPWEPLARPLERGIFASRRTFVATPRVTLYHERFSLGTHIQGMTPRGLLGIGVPVGRTSGSRYWDIEEGVGGFVVVCDSCVDVAFHAGLEQVVVLLDLDALRRDLSAETLEALERGARARRVPAARSTTAAFARWGMRLLDDASKCNHAPEMASVGRRLEEDVQRWVGVVAQGRQLATGDTPSQGRERALVRALDVLRDIHPNEITVPTVVAAARVSPRTLEYAFRERFGTSVLGYMRLRRLHLARHDLLFSRKPDVRVADVAARHGFGAHGRFSGAYRRHFGEHPSETLRTTPPRRQPDLTFPQLRPR